jgi:hypothetical protein
MLLQEQLAMIFFLLEMTLASWSFAIDEHDGHEDLCDSDHQSVIPYLNGRTVLYCSSLPCLCEPESFFLTPVKWRLPKHFIA